MTNMTNDKWHLENTIKEWLQRHVTFKTSDQSDEETWHDQQKDKRKDKDNEKDKYNDKDDDNEWWEQS